MQHTPTRRPRRARTLLVLLALVLAALSVAAAPALAANVGPTLDLTELQSKLAGGTPVPGYMKTVLNGTTVTDIPVRVLAIVDSSTWGKLIMFDSTDAQITDIGGVAAGMSGSPIYVTDGGADKMIGACHGCASSAWNGLVYADRRHHRRAGHLHAGRLGTGLGGAHQDRCCTCDGQVLRARRHVGRRGPQPRASAERQGRRGRGAGGGPDGHASAGPGRDRRAAGQAYKALATSLRPRASP